MKTQTSDKIKLTEKDFVDISDYDCAWVHMDHEFSMYGENKEQVKQILSALKLQELVMEFNKNNKDETKDWLIDLEEESKQ